MRINVFIAQASGLSRRAADTAIAAGRVRVNGQPAALGDQVEPTDTITLDGQALKSTDAIQTIILHKPVGYVCSRRGQGSKTIYELLPDDLRHLQPVGRLDKDSSGLLVLTNDGQLAHQLTHPSFQKEKVYEVTLDKPLQPDDRRQVTDQGVTLDDGPSRLSLKNITNDMLSWQVIMTEGRNRQIRRTFETLGYQIVKLHRTQFGSYRLGHLQSGRFRAQS